LVFQVVLHRFASTNPLNPCEKWMAFPQDPSKIPPTTLKNYTNDGPLQGLASIYGWLFGFRRKTAMMLWVEELDSSYLTNWIFQKL